MMRLHVSGRIFLLVLFIILISLIALVSVLHAAQTPVTSMAVLNHPGQAPYVVSQTIHIPGVPAKGWCYDVGWTANGRYYLSDDSKNQVDVLTIRTSAEVGGAPQIIGHDVFMGPMGCDQGDFSQEGPEGVEIFHGQLWAADGNSQVRVFDAQSGRLLHTVDTNGKFRADEMSISPTLGVVAVTNPDETFSKAHGTPYLTFISTQSYQVVASLPFAYAQPGQSGLQAPLWIGGNELLVDVPAPKGNTGGELDRVALDVDGYGHYRAQVLHRYALTNCSPSGLALDVSTGMAAVGCAGAQQLIWNLHTNRVSASLAIPGADIVAATGGYFFFPSYIKQTLTITNEQGKIVQTVKTSAQSHTVTADPVTDQVFVPLDGGNVMVLKPRT